MGGTHGTIPVDPVALISPVAKPRRGRPPGRTARQEEMRRQTRAAILDAASLVFSGTSYLTATIDDIIRTAKVSRATFYDHFETKLALAMAIYDSIAADWLQHFERLTDPAIVTQGMLEQWVSALATLYVEHGFVTPLVEQLAISEPNFRARLVRDRDALIERLARQGVPGFRTCADMDQAPPIDRAKARLLMLRLDQVCGMVARGDGMSDEEARAYISVIAAELRGQFMAADA